MENLGALTPEKINEFLKGAAEIQFSGQTRTERYAWVEATSDLLISPSYFGTTGNWN
jgi:hypothetical protein